MEEHFGRMQGEAVGLIAVVGLGDADRLAAQAGRELIEGVGELIGIAELLLKELTLAAGGPSDGGVEGEGHDGSRSGNAFEVGTKEAEEWLQFGSGIGNPKRGKVGATIVEVKGEEEAVGDALMSLQSSGEAVQESTEQEQQGVESFQWIVEVEVLAVVQRRSVELEQAMMTTSGNVMEAGRGRA